MSWAQPPRRTPQMYTVRPRAASAFRFRQIATATLGPLPARRRLSTSHENAYPRRHDSTRIACTVRSFRTSYHSEPHRISAMIARTLPAGRPRGGGCGDGGGAAMIPLGAADGPDG